MSQTVTTQLRVLRWYTGITTIILAALSTSAFTRSAQRTRFSEIDVERINVVESDGKVRMVIANRSRSPAPLSHGKPFLAASAGTRPGIIFYNDEQSENGGLTFSGERGPDGKYSATGHLSFDQYDQNQVVYLQYLDDNGKRHEGLTIADRADGSFAEYIAMRDSLRRLPAGSARTDALKLLDEPRPGELPPGSGVQRVFIGRDTSKTARVTLSDRFGHPRLVLSVDSLGTARIDFLDDAGRLVSSMPARSRRGGR
jgi:hypothetical protein